MQKKAPTNIAIPLARGNLLGLVNNLASNAINLKKNQWKRRCESRKRIYFIYFE